jgi:MbtH protein
MLFESGFASFRSPSLFGRIPLWAASVRTVSCCLGFPRNFVFLLMGYNPANRGSSSRRELSTYCQCKSKTMSAIDIEIPELEYEVTINNEEQYSIWPVDSAIPAGWRAVGKRAVKSECLAYIDETWTDMRPLSLRKAMNNA